ncbi:MAG: hypothetical protein P8Z79_08090 [Sedimentisphaerales bacterium]|jgi:ElaB/YqjD/DUF883 family membrane-anchored ribosome-binding protein
MASKLEKDVESLQKDIERFRTHLGDALSDVGSASHDKVLETRDRLRAAMEGFEGRAAKELGRANEALQEQGEKALNASREVVISRPLTTVLVSFGVGVMTAFLLDRHKG